MRRSSGGGGGLDRVSLCLKRRRGKLRLKLVLENHLKGVEMGERAIWYLMVRSKYE